MKKSPFLNGDVNASPPLLSFESLQCGTDPHQLGGGLHTLCRWVYAALDFFHLQETKNTYETLISFISFYPWYWNRDSRVHFYRWLLSLVWVVGWGRQVITLWKAHLLFPLPPSFPSYLSLSGPVAEYAASDLPQARMLSSESLQFLSDGCRSFQTSSELSSQSPAGSTSLNH